MVKFPVLHVVNKSDSPVDTTAGELHNVSSVYYTGAEWPDIPYTIIGNDVSGTASWTNTDEDGVAWYQAEMPADLATEDITAVVMTGAVYYDSELELPTVQQIEGVWLSLREGVLC